VGVGNNFDVGISVGVGVTIGVLKFLMFSFASSSFPFSSSFSLESLLINFFCSWVVLVVLFLMAYALRDISLFTKEDNTFNVLSMASFGRVID
jgi:hypothetical protein